MSSWTAYPKIYNLGHPGVRDLLLDPVVVEEKVDGSQFSFGDINGTLLIRSKGADIDPDNPPTMFKKAVDTVTRLFVEKKLTPGWTYRGEAFDKPKHNALVYDRVPEGNVILFDIATGPENYAPRNVKVLEAQVLGLEVVPVLFEGIVNNGVQIAEFLDRVSVLGGQKVEGVVLKNYGRFGIDGKPLMGKHVSEPFKEVHKGEWKKENPTNGDIISTLIASYRTPARWAKAVQHLREAGKLTDTPKDIGLLIIEVQNDVKAEEEQAIKDRLFAYAWGHVRRGITGGLPEWYKNELMAKQFQPTIVVMDEPFGGESPVA